MANSDWMNYKKPIPQYTGLLPPSEIAEGIKCAHNNALRLLEDAKLLRANSRLPSASALAILAIEEYGKIDILKHMALLSSPSDIKLEWRNYRSHRAKNSKWIFPHLVAGGARTINSLKDTINKDSDHTVILDIIKQHCFYTDTRRKGHWANPQEIMSEDFCDNIIETAEFLTSIRVPCLREIEAWREIVGPHFEKDTMANAVIEWQKLMFSEGISDITPEELDNFIRGEPFLKI